MELEPNAWIGPDQTPVVSLRDEAWAEALPVLLQALADGWVFWSIDDAVLLAPYPSGWHGTDQHRADPDDPTRSLVWAREHWWVED